MNLTPFWPSPSALRRSATATLRLPSPTTTLGHARAINSRGPTTSPAASRNEDVERSAADVDGFCAIQQQTFRRDQAVGYKRDDVTNGHGALTEANGIGGIIHLPTHAAPNYAPARSWLLADSQRRGAATPRAAATLTGRPGPPQPAFAGLAVLK